MGQIEAKDLRIGDYVECNDCICKIIMIDSFREEVVTEGSDGSTTAYCSLDCEDLSPIPLTEEILEANGWEEDRHGNMWKMFDDQKIEYFNGSISSFFHNLNNHVRYVHQLQHILWAMGLNSEIEVW